MTAPPDLAAGEISHLVHLAVREMPGSGKPSELMDAAKISAKHIAAAIKVLAGAPRRERDTTQAQRGEN